MSTPQLCSVSVSDSNLQSDCIVSSKSELISEELHTTERLRHRRLESATIQDKDPWQQIRKSHVLQQSFRC